MSLLPTVYSSADVGAPVLAGQNGSMVALLRAILVTGYGSKAGLGWTEPYTDAVNNVAVFRNNPISGTGYHLRVADNGDAAAGSSARSAGLRGYSTMSDVNTGTDITPTVAQKANGTLLIKSSTISATARSWWAIGTERCLYIFIESNGMGAETGTPNFIGDFTSFKPNDLHNFALAACLDPTYNGTTSAGHSQLFNAPQQINNAATASCQIGWVGRLRSGVIGAAAIANASVFTGLSVGYGATAGNQIPYPAPVNNGLFLDRARLFEAPYDFRGYLPGLYVPIHDRPFAQNQIVTDLVGMPAGQQLHARRWWGYYQHAGVTPGQVLFDLTSPW